MTTKYTEDHEWVAADGTVGITDHAQKQLGDVVFVELPEVGRVVTVGEACAIVESVKAASDIFAPVAGKVIAVNEAIVATPALVNEGAEGAAWFFKLEIADAKALAPLMDKAAYDAFCAES